jgi:hypothetical protein
MPSLASASDARTQVDRRIAAGAAAAVKIVNVSGSIMVVGADTKEVSVLGSLGPGVERLDIEDENGVIAIRVRLPSGKMSKSSYNNADAILNITMPASHRLEVSTVSADQVVRAVKGALEVSSVSGDVRLELPAQAAVKTVSGDINLTGGSSTGKWRVSSVSGDIVLQRGAGSLDLNTVSGDATVELAAINGFRGRTTSGDVVLRGKVPRGAEISLDSVSGNLNLAGPAEAGLSLIVNSFSGNVETCFPAEKSVSEKSSTRERVSIRRGEGAATVRVNSMSGDVEVCDR